MIVEDEGRWVEVHSGGRFYSTVPDSEKRECWLEENGRRKKKK